MEKIEIAKPTFNFADFTKGLCLMIEMRDMLVGQSNLGLLNPEQNEKLLELNEIIESFREPFFLGIAEIFKDNE